MIALCLGGAKTVWSDLERARELVPDASVVACNFAGRDYQGQLAAWVTLHPDMLPAWQEKRAKAGLNTDYRAFAHEKRRNGAVEVLPDRWSGSSGLYMAQVALEALGATHAILCGVPMDEARGHIHWGRWKLVPRYREGVLKAKAEGANIRSMSGFTADVLGTPDAHWLGRSA